MARYPWIRNPLYPDVLSAVYRFYAAGKRLIYVGVCGDFDLRFSQHRRTKFWWAEVESKDVILFDNRIDAMYEEARAIEEENPVYNGRPGFSRWGWMVIKNRHGWITDPRFDMQREDVGKRIMNNRNSHMLVTYDAEPKGVVVPWDWYLQACEAMGENRDEVMASAVPPSE